MPKYFWRGIDLNGKSCHGNMPAESFENLKSNLLAKNIALLSHKEKRSFSFSPDFFKKTKISHTDLSQLFNNLALLLESGIQLIDALRITKSYLRSKESKVVIENLIQEVIGGDSLSQAMETNFENFSRFMIHVTKSGERSGKLVDSLKNLSSYLERQSKLLKNLKRAALMPGITLVFSILVMLGIFIFVIPQFETLFSSMDRELPPSTQLIIKISELLRSWNFLLGAIIILGSIALSIKLISKTEKFSQIKDWLFLKLPVLREIITLSDLAYFTQSMALLLKTGNTLIQSLSTSCNVMQNHILKGNMKKITHDVEEGDSLEKAFHSYYKYFSSGMIDSISVGEKIGKLDL